MRLIDADKLYDWVKRECNHYGKPTIDFESGNKMLDMIKRSQTAFDKGRVIEELKAKAEDSRKYWSEFDDEDAFGEMNAYKNAIKIVEKGGIEA